MEVEKESLMKLRKLEAQLMNIIEKVDKEINQVDVEWLNLRSIAVEKAQSAQDQNPVDTTNKEHVYSSQSQIKKPITPVKNEFRDEFETLQLNLEVNPRVHQEIDEEFDSD